MSKPNTPEREAELIKFINDNIGLSYTDKILKWFQLNLNEIVISEELARIPGKKGKPISHNMRRVFELRDEQGYEILNWKDGDSGIKLRVNEWMLIKKDANLEKIRTRGVNKKIMMEVFTRDNFQCKTCGRIVGDDDPFKEGHKIALHVGHLVAHKQKDDEVHENKKLNADDFITMCNVCNEGAKNNDIKPITLVDRVKIASEEEKKLIYEYLRSQI